MVRKTGKDSIQTLGHWSILELMKERRKREVGGNLEEYAGLRNRVNRETRRIKEE